MTAKEVREKYRGYLEETKARLGFSDKELKIYIRGVIEGERLLLDSEEYELVEYGKWEEVADDWSGDTHYMCSTCSAEFYLEAGTPDDNEYYYCPKCGARMDGKNNG